MPIRIPDSRPDSQLSEAAREGLTTILMTVLIGFIAVRWFVVNRKKDKPKQS